MSTITFGKYAGKTPEQLKRIDPGYLAWGAQNLRNARWAAEFQAALESMTELDQAHAYTHDEPALDIDTALQMVRGQRAQEEEDAARFARVDAARDAVLARWTAVMGKSQAQLQGIAGRYQSDWQEAPRQMFSSDTAYGNFRQMMAEVGAAMDAAWRSK